MYLSLHFWDTLNMEEKIINKDVIWQILMSQKWLEAEIESLHDNIVWELVKLPEDWKEVSRKQIVFKVKTNADGSIERCKARLVAQPWIIWNYTRWILPLHSSMFTYKKKYIWSNLRVLCHKVKRTVWRKVFMDSNNLLDVGNQALGA